MDFLQGETGNSVTRQSQVPFMDCILFQIGQLEGIDLRGGWLANAQANLRTATKFAMRAVTALAYGLAGEYKPHNTSFNISSCNSASEPLICVLWVDLFPILNTLAAFSFNSSDIILAL